MTDVLVRATVEAIHASPTQAVLYLSGGASQSIGWLLSAPGASNTVLEAVVPYSRMSLIQLLGKVPPKFCSHQTAEELSLLAYNRALKLSRPGSSVLGVGFTGTLATTRPKLGDHRVHLSTRTSDRLWGSTVILSKGLRTREQEEILSSHLLLKVFIDFHVFDSLSNGHVFCTFNFLREVILLDEHIERAVANACKVPGKFVSELTESDVSNEFEKHYDEDEELEQLINGAICLKVYPFSSDAYMSNAERKVILPGSFNPLHDGHLKLLEVATSICGDGYPCFELSAVNPDKPPLSISQIKDRVKQFKECGKTVIISNQPYFYKKAELFPGSAFVIGADTAARLIQPKYYDNDYKKMLESLLRCKNTGCTFLVGGRNVNGVFKILEDFDIPDELKDMFISIPQEKFRMDISSTEIRTR